MYKVFDYEFEIPKTRNTENLKQGYWGEQWVANYFKSCGLKCELSNDEFSYYDNLLDLNNGKISKIQVKTLTRFVKDNCFSISEGRAKYTIANTKKCDTLIIICRTPNHPGIPHDIEFEGKVFIVKNHKKITLNKNEYIIPSNSKYLIHLGTLTKDELNQVNSFQTQKTKGNHG